MFRQYHAQQGRNRRTSEQKNAPRAPLAMRIAMRTCTGWRSTASDTDDGPFGHVSQFRNEKGGAGASLGLIRGCPGTPSNSQHARAPSETGIPAPQALRSRMMPNVMVNSNVIRQEMTHRRQKDPLRSAISIVLGWRGPISDFDIRMLTC